MQHPRHLEQRERTVPEWLPTEESAPREAASTDRVVLTEALRRRDTDVFDRFSALSNRALVIKMNRLLRL